ncbi:putative eka-like protein [Erysiphe necator]|uniref:Putative eka-like protein n=1 Tax=Uncinula necator TaxID=52586 RepID=A0A0B1NYT6_UNCNE|nr:putative eka-like protein [Erysiphe necator]
MHEILINIQIAKLTLGVTRILKTNITTDSPSTETGHQPPPIPPVPPISNSPSPTAPFTPPSNSAMSNTTIDCRQILKPVAPSKRHITERPTSESSDKSNSRNAFFPKELADIIAIRQRRERAWHARLLICTTIISSIDSALANFQDEIEKEVVAFKAYLRQAIASFAATDSSPSPPLV